MNSTSINDSIPAELLFEIFQFFDTFEFVELRAICKSWLEIIDENRSFWQVVNVVREDKQSTVSQGSVTMIQRRGKSLSWNQAILGKFDRMSGSTLREVSLRIVDYGWGDGDKGFSNWRSLVGTLQKSSEPTWIQKS